MPVPGQPIKKVQAKCPHCGSESCYHCWECGADVWSQSHIEGCNGLKSPTVPKCKACEGTGRTSNNKRCHPCAGTGRQGAYKDIAEVKTKPNTDVESLWG